MEKNISPEQINTLTRAALQAREHAYAPYSCFAVGAALLCDDGSIYCGCNVENASYGATNCAERTAIYKAVSEGKTDFAAIAIAGGLKEQAPEDYVYPCGICRQVLQEFCEADFQVYLVKGVDDYQVSTLAALLPNGFGGASIR